MVAERRCARLLPCPTPPLALQHRYGCGKFSEAILSNPFSPPAGTFTHNPLHFATPPSPTALDSALQPCPP